MTPTTPPPVPPPPTSQPAAGPGERVELVVARLLSIGAVVAVVLLVVGSILSIAAGTDPNTATYPAFDAGQVLADLIALRPEGFLWTGIVVVIATPIARVVGELIGFGRRRDRAMTLVAVATLLVIAASVVSALAAEA